MVENGNSYVLLDAGRFNPPDSCSRAELEKIQCGRVGIDMRSMEAMRLHQVVVGVEAGDASTYADALADISDAEGALVPGSATLLRAIALHNFG